MTDVAAAAATEAAVADERSRKRRKEEGKRNKRLRIQESGGVRPRSGNNNNVGGNDDDVAGGGRSSSSRQKGEGEGRRDELNDGNRRRGETTERPSDNGTSPRHAPPKIFEPSGDGQSRRPPPAGGPNGSPPHRGRPHGTTAAAQQHPPKHRFGRVMERVPCRNRPRFSSLSIALPGSVIANCQTRELRTLLVGQIARAATIYHVDEIVVFDDKLGNNGTNGTGHDGGNGYKTYRDFKKRGLDQDRAQAKKDEAPAGTDADEKGIDGGYKNGGNKREGQAGEDESHRRPRSSPSEFMCRLLQYCECPQYLRRNFFPMHPDLQFAGLLAPIDAPHHVRAEDHSKYREGIVLDKHSPSGKSLVNCGIRSRPVEYVRLACGAMKIIPPVMRLAHLQFSFF